MDLHIIEAESGFNWGKFGVAKFTRGEMRRPSFVDVGRPFTSLIGTRWGGVHDHVFVLDIQTGEGALFRPGGYPAADLTKHQIWVCPLFEPFLTWLYQQDLTDLTALPQVIQLPSDTASMYGYRRPGPLVDPRGRNPSPAELLDKFMTVEDLSAEQLAERLGCEPEFVASLLFCDEPITAQTALMLEAGIGVSADTWIHLGALKTLNNARAELRRAEREAAQQEQPS